MPKQSAKLQLCFGPTTEMSQINSSNSTTASVVGALLQKYPVELQAIKFEKGRLNTGVAGELASWGHWQAVHPPVYGQCGTQL